MNNFITDLWDEKSLWLTLKCKKITELKQELAEEIKYIVELSIKFYLWVKLCCKVNDDD